MISQNLIDMAYDYYNTHKNHEFVVTPSLPILYFGNLDAYLESETKILTVGKNPSDNEFRIKKADPYSFCRFPNWTGDKKNLLTVLNEYFENTPLKQWFASFKPILNEMDSSYYKNNIFCNTAIHTDVCSPLATNPTWSKLKQDKKNQLYDEGVELWHSLIEELQPDFMLISIPKSLFEKVILSNGEILISFKNNKDGTIKKKEYKVFLYKHQLNSGKQTKVVFGEAANKPFGTISQNQKKQIGELCLK